MVGKIPPSSDGATCTISVKISPEMNNEIEKLSWIETKYNKSEMIRILLYEAIQKRKDDETTINDLEKTFGNPKEE